MKKALLSLAACLLATVGLQAQVTGALPGSLMNRVTNGLFNNALDAAGNIDESAPGPDFSTLGKTYLFTGLDNLGTYFATSFGNSLPWLGIYLPGKMPMAFFDRLNWSGAGFEKATAASDHYTPKVVTSGTTTTAYQWLDEYTETSYRTRPFASVNNTFRANIALGALNAAAAFQYIGNDASSSLNNYSTIDSYYYDTAAAADAPAPALSYAVTTTKKQLAVDNTYRLDLGAFAKTGDLWHNAILGLSFKSSDASTGSSFLQDRAPRDPASGASSYLNSSNSASDGASALIAGLNYTLSFAPGGGEPEADRFYLNSSVSVELDGRSYAEDNSSAMFSYAGGGAAGTADTASRNTVAATLAATPAEDLSLTAGKYLYFDPLPSLKIGFNPFGTVSYSYYTNGVSCSSMQTVTYADNDNSGSFDGAADRITTITETYSDMVLPAGGTTVEALSQTNYVAVNAGLKSGAVYAVPGLPFQFMAGAAPSLSYTVQVKSDLEGSTSSTTHVVDGTGAQVGNTTVSVTRTGSSQMSITTNWATNLNLQLGLHASLGQNVDLDLLLNGGNLLSFDSLTFQLIYALK